LGGFGDSTHFFYGNFNSGETHVIQRAMVNDARFSFNDVTFDFDRHTFSTLRSTSPGLLQALEMPLV